MNKAVNILVTSAGRRVELVKCFAAARDALGLAGNVVCCDMDANAPALQFADCACLAPRIDSGKYTGALVDIARKQAISLIVPTIDTELPLLAEAQGEIEKATGAKVLVSSPECIATCRDKERTARFFAANGLDFPRTYSRGELASPNLAFPLFIKPRGGSSSIGAFRVENRRELDFFLGYVRDPIIQDCVAGAEYSVDAFLDFNAEIISVVPRRRLAVRAGEILRGRIDMAPAVIAAAHRLLKALAPIGPVTVQGFLCEDGKFRFTEVNPRFGGGAPMSIAAGADSCSNLYRLLSGMPVPKPQIRDGATFSRFDQTIEITRRGGPAQEP